MRTAEKERVCEKMEKELSGIMDEGKLTPNGLENASKMVDIIKDIKNMEYWDAKREYYESMMDGGYSREMDGDYSRNRGNDMNPRDDYDNGNSYRRGRAANGKYKHMPNYSRLAGDDNAMDRYKEDKKNYSNSRDGRDKDRMLDSLETLVANVCDMVAQVYRDCDCPEEREVIKRHISRLYDKLDR